MYAVSYYFFSQPCVNRVIIEDAKKLYGRFPAAGGPEGNNMDAKVIYPRQFNYVPTNQVWRKQNAYEHNKSQTPHFYFPRFIYRNTQSLPNQ